MAGAALSGVLRKYERALAENGDVVWGEFDCLRFGIEAAAAVGRRDLLPMVPNYSTPIGAMRALRKMGFASIMEAMDAHATPISGARAMPGDIAYFDQPPMGMIGVVIGADAVFLHAEGFVRVRAAELCCWRP